MPEPITQGEFPVISTFRFPFESEYRRNFVHAVLFPARDGPARWTVRPSAGARP
jgi:hypothetical protein